jgi:hypothetical protein
VSSGDASRLANYALAGFFALVTVILVPTAIILLGGSPGLALVAVAIVAVVLVASVFGVIGYRDARREGLGHTRAGFRALRPAVTFWWSLGA